jgi:hypothetical protein
VRNFSPQIYAFIDTIYHVPHAADAIASTLRGYKPQALTVENEYNRPTAYAAFHVFHPDFNEADIQFADYKFGYWKRTTREVAGYVGKRLKWITFKVDGNTEAYEHPEMFPGLFLFDRAATTNGLVLNVVKRFNNGASHYILVRFDIASQEEALRLPSADEIFPIDHTEGAKDLTLDGELFVCGNCYTNPCVCGTEKTQTHVHKCVKCHTEYEHEHKFTYASHTQFEYQCPNTSCEWYFGNSADEMHKGNPTKSTTLKQPKLRPKLDPGASAMDLKTGLFDLNKFANGRTYFATSEDKTPIAFKVIKGSVCAQTLYRTNGYFPFRYNYDRISVREEEYSFVVDLKVFYSLMRKIVTADEVNAAFLRKLVASALNTEHGVDPDLLPILIETAVKSVLHIEARIQVMLERVETSTLNQLKKGNYSADWKSAPVKSVLSKLVGDTYVSTSSDLVLPPLTTVGVKPQLTITKMEFVVQPATKVKQEAKKLKTKEKLVSLMCCCPDSTSEPETEIVCNEPIKPIVLPKKVVAPVVEDDPTFGFVYRKGNKVFLEEEVEPVIPITGKKDFLSLFSSDNKFLLNDVNRDMEQGFDAKFV